jgi:hypothetical protein
VFFENAKNFDIFSFSTDHRHFASTAPMLS